MSSPLLLLLKRRQRRRQQGQGSDDTGLMDTLTNVVGVLALITSLTAIFATSATLNIQAPMAQRSKQAFHLLQANGDGIWDLQPAVAAMATADRERVAAVQRWDGGGSIAERALRLHACHADDAEAAPPHA